MGTPNSYFEEEPTADYVQDLHAGLSREMKLAAELKADGWGIVHEEHPLPFKARTYMANHSMRSPFIEWPDLIAIRAPHLVMIEVKATLTWSANIRASQVDSYRRLTAIGRLLIVWLHEDTDIWWALPAEHLTHELLGEVLPSTNSQGHPFHRIDPAKLAPLTELLP